MLSGVQRPRSLEALSNLVKNVEEIRIDSHVHLSPFNSPFHPPLHTLSLASDLAADSALSRTSLEASAEANF